MKKELDNNLENQNDNVSNNLKNDEVVESDLECQNDDALNQDLIDDLKDDEIIEEIVFCIDALEGDTNKDSESTESKSSDDYSLETNDESSVNEEDSKKSTLTYEELKKNNKKIIFKSVVASSIASLIVSGGILHLNKNATNNVSSQITITNKNVDNVYKAVAQKAESSVVGITTLTINTNNFFNLPLESEGIGSGIIVDKNGYILTNSHVVSDGKASKVSVIFSDATSIDGEVLWNDAKLDLAIVKVDRTDLQPAELGDSDEAEVGDISIAIGNPLGLEFNKTVTQGIISGLNRTITTENGEMTDLIQTDASINPGNSGGPLFNDKGQVIGINTAKASDAEGLGFAIPINIAKTIIEQVISEGSFEKVVLGIKGFDASQFEMSVSEGVYVIEVEENSSAKKAGISSGDIIVKVNDKDITNMSDLTKALYKYKTGDKVKVKILKDGVEKEVEVQF